MGCEIDPIWDTFIESKPDRTGVEVTVRIRRRMKVQLRNEMLVQCSSEFFVTLLIAADEDCLVQSKRTATKYIIYFSGIVNNSFSHITGNRITNLISFDIYIYILKENKFGVILLPIIYTYIYIYV